MADAEHSSIGHARSSSKGSGTQYNVTGSGLQLLHSGTGDQNVNSGQGIQFNYIEWLRQHATFQDWIKRDRSLLWIKGKPGSGKSTLLKCMLCTAEEELVLRDHSIVLSFFFHGRGTELQKSLLGLFRSLLHQLSLRVPESLSTLVDTFKKRCDTIVWLFVGALDECGEENAVHPIDYLKLLITKLSPTTHPFRVCFSCRHYPILELDYGLAISMKHVNHEDIATFVKTQLSTLGKGTASTITDTITRRADGVFTWARLVVKDVLTLTRKGEGVRRIQVEIQRIPPDLDDLYDGLLRSMEQRARSRRLIQWICFSTSPPSIEELRWAMAEPDEYTRDDETMERKINTLSCGLVETVWFSDSRIMQFIHQSVEDFFIKKGLSALATLDSGDIEGVYQHDIYESLSWTPLTHAVSEGHKGIVISLLDSGKLDIEAKYYLSCTSLWHASWKGHKNILNLLLNTGKVDVEARDYQSRTPLSQAALGGHEGVVQLLLTTEKADVETKDDNDRKPLWWAAWRGDEGVLKLLINTGRFDIEARDNQGCTPLCRATLGGHEGAIQLLIDIVKADIQAEDKNGRTPRW
ncbi:ankyrin repeat-containing domain protein [Dactylonectria macrodidyma]|uniref:Ankyrin repeat-containing domain protein n=1 Tax=Dactylonectria macrodidyma TaxID=307937 RepID=A0A9P9INV9_9HYPO|nr:ankyrin repeat-containing domain protein [Dactylonectria macrodidyma]